jgi:hypothetical protein
METMVKINYCGHDLMVDGIYEKGEPRTEDYAGSGSCFQINYINLGDYEISGLLGCAIGEIRDLVIDKIEGR